MKYQIVFTDFKGNRIVKEKMTISEAEQFAFKNNYSQAFIVDGRPNPYYKFNY